MKAMVFGASGGVEVLEEVEVARPSIGEDEVLVEVRACGLNHLDLWMRQGLPMKIPMPHIGGCEPTGVVAEVGGAVKGFQPGDRVMIAPGLSCRHCAACLRGEDPLCPEYKIFGLQTQGGFAEYAAAKAHDCIAISETWSFAEWAAVPLTFLTAWRMLLHHGQLRPGMDVLVQAAGSGVGTAAIQIAKRVGARVFATAGSDEKLQHALELGADFVINYSRPAESGDEGAGDWADEVLARSEGRGMDVVVEHIGASVWKGSLKVLKAGGRLVTCGATSGPKVEVDLRFFFTREIAVLGSYMGSRSELLEVLRLVERRELRPVVDQVFPLSQLREAQQRMARREQFGKIVVEPV